MCNALVCSERNPIRERRQHPRSQESCCRNGGKNSPRREGPSRRGGRKLFYARGERDSCCAGGRNNPGLRPHHDFGLVGGPQALLTRSATNPGVGYRLVRSEASLVRETPGSRLLEEEVSWNWQRKRSGSPRWLLAWVS